MNNIEIKDINIIAKWLLHVEPMTHKKLQKLLYFCYGIYLVQNNEENNLNDFLFENNFEAWVHGPVDPYIYSLYKNNGINYLYIEECDKFDFKEKVFKALNKTLDLYGEYSADVLEIVSHNQTPWINARGNIDAIEPSNNKLSDNDIYNTFKEVLNNE